MEAKKLKKHGLNFFQPQKSWKNQTPLCGQNLARTWTAPAPARDPTRAHNVKPHRSKCLPTSFPHNYFFDIFCSQNPCEVFLGPGLFFRPRRILIFWRLVNTFVLDVSSKKVLLKFLYTFLTQTVKVQEKELLTLFDSFYHQKSFFHY